MYKRQPWKLPLINTILLVTSSFTVTFAHHALKKNKRGPLKAWLALTVLLGIAFLILQAEEYVHAYNELGLTLGAGIYGSTFFMLTGFHGAHVTLGALILGIMLIRILRGHFDAEHHFGFEAASWYWHFVDVVSVSYTHLRSHRLVARVARVEHHLVHRAGMHHQLVAGGAELPDHVDIVRGHELHLHLEMCIRDRTSPMSVPVALPPLVMPA